MVDFDDPEYLDAVESDAFDLLARLGNSVDALPPVQKLVVLRRAFQTELNNGGLPVYLYNSPGDHARDAQRMLELIGATEAARILTDAIAVFGEAGPSTDCLIRRQELRRLTKEQSRQLERLSDEYLRLEDAGMETSELLSRYLRARNRE